ncbi:D-alanyl-D-alanine carboxypeptidase/D-alanyl-D-alanine-endopeptidase [Arthrobacter jiangjiafuii]|uniref:D-alanyl-D-alanine carboxypeptidase/D-alanyl-D-alanine endopeptidase n=1 Tax=Arthrobacter jiangjiafuii TaxID=2817475 RepID=UPI001F0007B5|nr:D-alanyl-D-alanine carboxypeptidase/D-alanyl-D-alanine-endopeptidase [Arthrobacter jiangjiafuii]
MGRVFSGLLLTLVLAALVVPLGLYAGPPVLAALANKQPQRQEPVPAYQQAPLQLGAAGPVFPAPAGLSAPLPAADELAALLDAELMVAGSGEFHGTVLDALTGEVLYDRAGTTPVMPASSLKILTAAAALSSLGAGTRFETTVVAGDEPGTVVLTGGGDVLLGSGASQPEEVVGHAGLQDLAEDTAKALAEANSGAPETVRILVDDTLFTGPALSPAWNIDDVEAGEAAALYPLAINSAWATEGIQNGPRTDDAALAAAEAFGQALGTAAAGYGIAVDPVIERGTAGDGAERLAAVESATVGEQVRQMLLISDNYLAEALARMTALADGAEGSYDGGTQAILSAVSGLGVDTASMVLADASGLGAGTEISARQLARTVQAALTSENNDLRGLASSLPVAGLSGTLSNRFDDTGLEDSTEDADGAPAAPESAAGLVRAKTGTLLAVTSLSGFVTDADGRLLAFAFVANGLDANTAQARAAVDAAAAVLAGCGCR